MFGSLESGLDTVFLVSAVVGGTVFVFQTIMQLLGVSHGDSNADLGLHGHFGGDVGGDVHADLGSGHAVGADAHSDSGSHDADSSFRYLSLQTLSTFFMMSGLAGLAMHQQSTLPAWISIIGALVVGIAAVRVMASIFRVMFGLQSSGNADMTTAVGSSATVYLQILPGESGQIEVVVGSRRRICDAVHEADAVIPTGAAVRVTRLLPGGTFVVERMQENGK